MESRKDNKRISRIFDMIVYGMMIVAIIFIIIQTFANQFTGIGFRVTLGVWILLAVAISDYVGPVYAGELKDYSTKQLYKFVFSAIIDGLAYMCLYVFIIFVGDYKEISHYLFLVGAIAMFAVRFLLNRSIGEPEYAAYHEQKDKQESMSVTEAESKEDEEDDYVLQTFKRRREDKEANKN